MLPIKQPPEPILNCSNYLEVNSSKAQASKGRFRKPTLNGGTRDELSKFIG